MSYNPKYVGAVALGSARQTQTGYQNGTVSTIPLTSLVSTNSSGQLVLTNVTAEANVEACVGITSQAIPSTAIGLVISDGRVENISTSLGLAAGDVLWAGLTPGSLTTVKPDLTNGWASGDYVIFVGIVVVNEFNPANLDIQLSRQIIGQL
jgi:hypothetical protein